ncbi:NAD(P)(+) transhydrogenase (Re/Si-specific) subunit beta [Dehalobacterium formicoaceticum]|uniref:proton-translocating NAD(P)(+) transhydrogenase n=1 Tax=Dehalobacterium formicoaceticum TaxID=51515 RepID=A0ABT1Y274_9FIRM|nr:NAD(P)(+) transhydrogenase (Re/Si-specific) subunit beta [Dehalobacterium formicoaceticum]MCR6544658.1 NAD(P)(+) transhydrogenase (Re/Si-specific) subunit beta [Dehalobacterium formicoaceticum]
MMSVIMYFIISVILALFILYDLFLMSSPKTAVKGNIIGAGAIFIAIIVTLYYYQIIGLGILWICLLIGGAIGLYLGGRVKMIQMPEMVAFLHGLGGLAAVLLSITVLTNPVEITTFTLTTGMLALVVGGLTFSGSMVAASKLHGVISSKPVVFPGHNTISIITIFVMLLSVLLSVIWPHYLIPILAFSLIVSLFFGYLFTIRVGGADMPITISLLNSCSGVTGAMVGMATYDPLLVAGGGIVASAGYLLTEIMCRAMNRSLLDVLAGKTTLSGKSGGAKGGGLPKKEESAVKQEKAAIAQKKTPQQILGEAKSVILVPGYGVALAQAQFEVKKLADKLEKQGKVVKFAIHPVAGRMPGHMNVLLAEVDVPYDQLYEMDAINPEFAATDVVIVVGANDVVNPAANTAEGSPIYGMPILNVDQAKHVIVCNYDTKPGYAGVDNPLYSNDENVTLILGDAKATIGQLNDSLDGKNPQQAGSQSQGGQDQYQALRDAKRIIIVPGYGMALAQAQFEVKKLADKLEKQGKDVKFAIHPVAGRMPGHMNVLLAEVDVPYDQLYEMDAINPEFASTDVVIVVGANDVVNPAANTAEGSPIYGMPILNVDQSKHVFICNFDTKPGYAGVDNPLYSNQDKVTLLLGDAKDTVAKLDIALDAQETPDEATPMTKQDQYQALRDAKRIIIVPGYGMALAQAQFEVKKLADKLEKQGKDVKFAIHPVAGRMPGHMNVLLAEVDVPYDQLYEMDAINPEFAATDVVIVVGANDVVNPAANTAEGSPIYGMPILNVDQAKHVIICNFDTKPGYAGVDNPLYSNQDKVTLLLGDAKETVAQLDSEIN